MNQSTSSTTSSDRRRKKQGIFCATAMRQHSISRLMQSTLSSWKATPATAPLSVSNSYAEEQSMFKCPFSPKNNQMTANVSGNDGSSLTTKRHKFDGGFGFSCQTVNSPSAVKTIDITNSQPYKFEKDFERLTSGHASDERKSTVRLGELSERMDRHLSQQNSQTQQKDNSYVAQRQGNGGNAIGLVRHFLMDINDNEPSSDYVNRTQLDRLKKEDQILHTDLFRKDRPTHRACARNNYNNFKKAKQGRFYRRVDDDGEINDGGSVDQTPRRDCHFSAPTILSCSTPYITPSRQQKETEMAN